MTLFKDLGLNPNLLKALDREGYETPTPIQEKAIPHLIEGRDCIGIAQTGTGKTASFVLPTLHQLAASDERARPRSCRALILAPTRELVTQITESVRAYSRFSKVFVTSVVGGVKPGPQVRALEKGVDILVATPGRLLDHMGTGALRLKYTRMVVLDEADQMLDMGFIPAIRQVMEALPNQRQTMLLSATMPKPIRALAADFLTDPAEVSVAPAARPIEKIDQRVIHVARLDKRQKLVEVLSEEPIDRAIVFTRTKHGADRVTRQLEQAGLSAAAIHGNKSQNQRDRALRAFKAGKMPILVATDIAARGIDVDGVSHVVNFELPNLPEAYVHRIGRTARAGASGVAVSFCDGSEQGYLKDIERLIGKELPASGDVQAPEAPPHKKSGQRANARGRKPGGQAKGPSQGRNAGGNNRPQPRNGKPGNRKRPSKRNRPAASA
ncbi:MAG: DEAD/DEAH box helicase [Magnetovibrionaceae bacterium]